MPEREDNIRRLRNVFEEAAAYSEEEEAARLGVSVAEYRRGKDVGVWRKGDGGPRRAGNAQLPAFRDDQRLRRAPGTANFPRASDRPGYRNDT
jgi:hypothetical protein